MIPKSLRRAHTKQKFRQPDGYYAQVTPLKHMHSAAKFRAVLDTHHAEILASL